MNDRDAGFAGGFAGLLFGLLLFVGGTLLAANAWGVVDTKNAAVEAARQAVRTYVQAPDSATAYSQAQLAADQALSGYGRNPSRAQIRVVSGGFARCERVTIEVSYPAPALVLPFVGRIGTGQAVRAEQSELVDAYRTGLAGTASCP
jgi:hypothetical protein